MKIIYSFILLSLISFVATAQKKADLSFNLELNKVYRLKTTTVQSTTQTVMGNEQSVQTNSTSVISLKPLKQMDGEMVVEVRFDTINTVISQPPMEILSANPGDIHSTDPAQVMECIMNRMTNSTFVVKMTNTGRVVQIMNLEPLATGILSGTDSLQGQAAMIRQRINTMVEEESLTSMIESGTGYLPGKEVKVGEKWDYSLDMAGGGMKMTQNSTYTLKELDKNSAVLSGDIIIETKPATMEMNGAQITPDLRGLGKTELTIDPKTGWIIKGTTKMQIKGELSVNAQGNNMTIPMEIISDSEVVTLP